MAILDFIINIIDVFKENPIIGTGLIAMLIAYWWFFMKTPYISTPPSHKNLKHYFNKLDKDFNAWKRRFVIDRQMNLEKMPIYAEEVQFYIPLLGEEVDENKSLRKGDVEELRQQLKANQEFSMILSGQAGIGKTTSLRYLVYQDRKSYQPESPIPVYLELKNAPDNMSLLEWIVSKFKVGTLAKVPNLTEKVEQWLEQGLINLYLDGWNEISPELEAKLFKDVEQFIHNYDKVFIIISIREAKIIFNNVAVFALQNMDKQQVDNFIDRNTDNDTEYALRKHIKDYIEAQPRFLEFIQIPLYALMLIQIVRKENIIPENQAKVIEKFITALLLRDSQKGPSIEKKLDFDMKDFKLLLAYFAYDCVFEKGQQNTGLSLNYIQEIFKKYEPNISVSKTRKLLQFALDLGIMVLSKPEAKYSFTHQEYQTYFASLILNQAN